MKYIKNSTLPVGNVENVIGQDLSPIGNGNSKLFPDNSRTVY